jgi:hypothetical protein
MLWFIITQILISEFYDDSCRELTLLCMDLLTVICYTYTQLIKILMSTYVIPLECCEHDCSQPTALPSLLSVQLLQAER